MRKKVITVIVGCLFLMLFSACGGTSSSSAPASSASAAAADTIKMGMFYEMTGNMAVNGERHNNAATMVI